MVALTGCRLSEGLGGGRADLHPVAGSLAIRSLKKRGATIVREVLVSDESVQRWLGYADTTTTTSYADVMDAEERETAGRMW